jgi:polar amino acid transport system substrate-binding protein
MISHRENTMRFLRQIILIGSIALSIAHAAFAQKITVVTEEYPPYNFLDSNKKVSGMSTDVVEEVLRRAKLDYHLEIYPWARAYKMAQDTPYVLIYSIGRSAKRETLFKWVDVIAPYDVYLYKLKSRPEIQVTKLDELKNFKIGAVRDDIRAQYLEKLGLKLDLTSADSFNSKKLAVNRIDMFPIDEVALIALYKREGVDPDTVVKVFKLEDLSSGLYMAFSKQTPDEVVNKCKTALAEIKKDGTLEKIRLKYLN